MKKFLVILMVVAMASFLFVGCTTPPTPEPEPEPEPTPTPTVKTETPFITSIGALTGAISLSSTSTQYTNDPTVIGVGVAGAIIKVYINDVQTGVGQTGTGGSFTSIGVTMATLTEGTSTLYITATQPGLAESDKSTEYSFVYDETPPSIVSAVADSTAGTVTVTFDGDVEVRTTGTTAQLLTSAMSIINWTWYNGSAASAVLVLDVDRIARVSDKVVTITPVTNVVGAAGTGFYITCAATVLDKAGNANTAAISFAGVSVP